MLLEFLNQEWFTMVLIASIFVIFAFLIINLTAKSHRIVTGLKRKSRLFSASERHFFESLTDALDYDFHIFARVNVLEVISRGPQISKSRFKRIARILQNETFDYVVCKKKDLSITAVIELDCQDRRTSVKKKQKRDSLIAEVCKASKLKLFYFDTRQNYQGLDIRRLITGSSECSTPSVKAEKQSRDSESSLSLHSHSMLTENFGQNSCPKCSSELVTKIAVKGKHIGERFLMCRRFPYCDHKLLLNDSNILNLHSSSIEQKNEVRKGFTDWHG